VSCSNRILRGFTPQYKTRLYLLDCNKHSSLLCKRVRHKQKSFMRSVDGKNKDFVMFLLFLLRLETKSFFLLGNGKQSVDNVKLFFPSLLKLRAKKLACLSLASIFILV
jgi:hypothetical protein